jgi:hypothetical protein
MRKTILLVFAILLSNLVVAQSSDLIFKGNIVGYYNQQGVPVVNVNLGYDDAQQFKSEHEVYIFAPGRVKPNNARPPQSSIGYQSNMEGQVDSKVDSKLDFHPVSRIIRLCIFRLNNTY